MSKHVGKRAATTPADPAVQRTPATSSVGKRTLVEQVRAPVQQRGPGEAVPGGDADGPASVHAAAARGVATPSTTLPHYSMIQRAFGRHDLSAVQAHAGPQARASADAMGADAYATGNHVVLGKGTDLFTAAHEAAHVVQQRGGVQLKGGVGEAGDAYEHHADEVASLVVQGKSAESLLDRYAGGSVPATGSGPVQRMQPEARPGEPAAHVESEMDAWDTSRVQADDVAAAKTGDLSQARRTRLADEIRRQVPDIALVDAVRAGAARTVLSVVTPGGGETGVKRMNDELVGYAINSTLIQGRNRLIKEAFEAEGITVVDQNYKTTTLVSDKAPAALVGALKRVLAAIDAGMKPLLEQTLQAGLEYWTADRASRRPEDPEYKNATRRIDAIAAQLGKLQATKDFHFDVQAGVAEIKGDRDASYSDILGSEMDATKAAIMARDTTVERSSEIADDRVVTYSREQFVQFCQETVALKARVKGKTLPYHGQRKEVFNGDGTMNRDILRAIRKDAYVEELTPEEQATLSVLQQYFKRVNVFDYNNRFAGDEVGLQGEKVEAASALIKELHGSEPITPDVAGKIGNILRGDVAQAGTASEALFYNRAAQLRDRTVLNADIKDLGLEVFEGYAATMDAVGSGKTSDLVAASQGASDRVLEYKRRANSEFKRFYKDELVPRARDRASDRHREDLLPAIAQELEPLVLLGGDEITVSLHALFEELGLVPQAVAKLTDPSVANARVAVTHSSALDEGAAGHVEAMDRAQSGQDRLKKEYEPLARELRQKALELGAEPARRANELADLFDRMYIADANGASVFRDREGAVVDVTAREAEAKNLLAAKDPGHGD